MPEGKVIFSCNPEKCFEANRDLTWAVFSGQWFRGGGFSVECDFEDKLFVILQRGFSLRYAKVIQSSRGFARALRCGCEPLSSEMRQANVQYALPAQRRIGRAADDG